VDGCLKRCLHEQSVLQKRSKTSQGSQGKIVGVMGTIAGSFTGGVMSRFDGSFKRCF
jgi:hypothetical protein